MSIIHLDKPRNCRFNLASWMIAKHFVNETKDPQQTVLRFIWASLILDSPELTFEALENLLDAETLPPALSTASAEFMKFAEALKASRPEKKRKNSFRKGRGA